MSSVDWNFPKLVARILAVAGIAAIAAGLFLPWYRVPDRVEWAADGAVIVTTLGSLSEPIFKAIVAAAGLSVLLLLRRGRWRNPRQRSRVMTVASITLAGVGLCFPQCVIVRETDLSFRAACLEEQHDSLVWFGGDIYTSREFSYLGEGMPVDVKDMPALLAAVPVPNLEWDLLKLHEFIAWSGFTPAFWEFVRGGWAMTMLGCLGIVIGSAGVRGGDYGRREGRNVTGRAAAAFGMTGLLFFAVTSVQVVGAARNLEGAREALREGDHARARKRLDRACLFFPCLRFDTSVLLQMGRIDGAPGPGPGPKAKTRERALHEAFELERRGYTQQAGRCYLALFQSGPDAVAGEAGRCLLRLAIDRFNSGDLEGARRTVDVLLERSPAAIKGHYMRLLFAQWRNDRKSAERTAEALTGIYLKFQAPEKRGVLATAHGIVAELRHNAEDPGATLESFRNRVSLP